MRVPGHQRGSSAWRWAAVLFGAAAVAIALVVGLMLPGGSHAAPTIYVDADDPGCTDLGTGTTSAPFCTIQAAVDFAGTVSAPWVVEVRPATYTEDVDVDPGGAITIRGQASASRDAILLNPPATYGFSVVDDGVTIQHLRIDCNTNGADGIRIDTTADMGTFTDLHIEECAKGIDSAAGVGSDDNVIQQSLIEDNTAEGINLRDGEDNTIANNTIRDNGGDGARLDDEDRAVISGNTSQNNTADGVILTSSATSTGTSISGNTIRDSGDDGLVVISQDDVTITNNSIINNSDNQVEIGGASTGDVDLTNNLIDVDSDGILLDTTCNCGGVDINGTANSALANQFRGLLGAGEFFVINSSGDTVDAQLNDWNDYSDPADKICADNATVCGAANGDVNFTPFLTGPGGGPPTPTPTPTPTSSPTPESRGDVNCDTVIDAVDALFILQCVVGLRPCEFEC